MTGKDEIGIPDDWQYKTFKIGCWPFRAVKKVPYCWLVEGTNSLQALCPNCGYGNGYNVSVHAAIPANEHLVICETCKTEFISIGIIDR